MTTTAHEMTDMSGRLTAEGFTGEAIGEGDPGYDGARALYNAMIDRRPRMIARCATDADVQAVVRTAAATGVDLAIRGAGHNGAGLGSIDGGLVADLSGMRDISVDADTATVRVQAGCTWGEVDAATHRVGMATPSGIIAGTGVGGLTLGGRPWVPQPQVRPDDRQPAACRRRAGGWFAGDRRRRRVQRPVLGAARWWR